MTPAEKLLYAQQEADIQRKPRVDLKLEKTIILCAIGLLSDNRELNRQDYTRLHLAVARVRVSE